MLVNFRLALLRAIVLDNGLVHLIQASAPDMIGLVADDQRRTADLVAFLMEKKDELLNEYATMGQFSVVFQPQDDEDQI